MIKGEICWPKAPMGYKKARRILKYAVLFLFYKPKCRLISLMRAI